MPIVKTGETVATPGHDNNKVRVLDKAFGLLATLNAERGLSVAALARRLGIPRPTINRILQSLVSEGLVARTPNDGLYCAAHRARELSRREALWPALEAAAEPVLRNAQKTMPWPLFVPAVLDSHVVVVASTEARVHFLPRKMVRGTVLAEQSPLAQWLRAETASPAALRGATGPESWMAVRIPLSPIQGSAALAVRIPAAAEHAAKWLESSAADLQERAQTIAAALPAEELSVETVDIARHAATKSPRTRRSAAAKTR